MNPEGFLADAPQFNYLTGNVFEFVKLVVSSCFYEI